MLKSSWDKISYSVPKYLTLGFNNEYKGTTASLPNISKKGLFLECLFGKELYAAQARGITLSYSSDFKKMF